MINRIRTASLLCLPTLLVACAAVDGPAAGGGEEQRLPNVVIVFADDMGYADLACFGARGIKTPHLDRMAAEGVRFTDFHVAQPVCSASRAALLTGCYPNRIGIHGALGPGARHGIHPDEMTLAELVKQKGYATAIFGKWHLGHHREFLPQQHGFDEFYGIPYSNDMWPLHPTAKKGTYPPLPTIAGNETIETNGDQTRFTADFTEHAVQFIEKNKDRPFFVYVPHPMPHVPLFVSDRFKGESQAGLYGDVIQEIDWSVGRILKCLRDLGLDEHTLVIFTSDNGPWLSYGDHAGSALPLREGKGTSWEGGVRVPCVMRWPGRIPAGTTCTEPAMTIDILPTIARLIGAQLPDHPIDGADIWPLMAGEPGAKSPQEAYFFYYHTHQLHAVRSGKWKLVLPFRYRTLNGREGGTGGTPVPYDHHDSELALYDLEADVTESTNVAAEHPEVMQRLMQLVEQSRQRLGDSLTKRKGSELREPGRLKKTAGS